jgi:predicted RNA-binding Zn ribbon-like protein
MPERSPLEQPSAAGPVLAFVNTHTDAGGSPERFGSAEDLKEWLEETGLDARSGPGPVTEADAAGARELRDALITVLLTHSGDKDTPPEALARAEDHLRHVASRYPLVAHVTATGASLVSEQAGVPGVFGTVLAGVTELAQSGAWGRVKACRNPPCHFGFFDRTRNGSAVYCSSTCNSQASMRAYRRRKKDLAALEG